MSSKPTIELDFKLLPQQADFIKSNADEVLYGGGAGGGKSYAQLIDALLYALKNEGSRQLILRRTLKDLDRSLISEHLKFYPRGVYTYKKSEHTGCFDNGSVIEFGYCDNEQDVYRYQGAQYDVVRFDELTHFTQSMYTYLHSRVRGVNDFHKSVKSATNPGGIGHEWVKKRFIDIGPANVMHSFENGNRLFIPSLAKDNVYLMEKDKAYLKRLKALSIKEKKALLYGEWNIHDGCFFYEFATENHVIKPFEIPKHWRRYVCLDYGMDMLAALWIAVDEGNRAYVYKELYEGRDNGMGADGKGHIISQAAMRILQTNKKDNIYAYLAPPDLWNRRQETGKSVVDIFAQNGVILTKTSNNRSDGWLAVREWLKLTRDEFGKEAPLLRIFDICINTIRTLPALQYSEKGFTDVSSTPHELTHAPDALRGFCVCNTVATSCLKEKSNSVLGQFNINKKGSTLGEGMEITII